MRSGSTWGRSSTGSSIRAAAERARTPVGRYGEALASVRPETVLEKAGLSASDLGAVELDEAFASRSLACIPRLGLDDGIVYAGGSGRTLRDARNFSCCCGESG